MAVGCRVGVVVAWLKGENGFVWIGGFKYWGFQLSSVGWLPPGVRVPPLTSNELMLLFCSAKSKFFYSFSFGMHSAAAAAAAAAVTCDHHETTDDHGRSSKPPSANK